MGSLADYAENELLDHIFNAAYSPVATVYVGLSTADPLDDHSGMAEVSGNNYSRVAITFGAAASRRVTQSAQISFPQASGSWGTITHWFICDHASNTTWGTNVNLLAHGSFSASFAPVAGNTPVIASGQIYVEIGATAGGAGFSDYAVHNLLNLMFRNVAFTSPANNTFIALLAATADDQDVDDGDITEVTGTSYARKEVNPNGGSAPTWDLASGGALDNGEAITFATPGAGGWDEVVAIAIVDTVSGSCNVLAYDNSNIVDQTPAEGDTVQFAIGAFDVSLT